MGVRNYLIEGVSGSGKSAVCRELGRRGYAVVDGDNELAYQGDPETGEVLEGACHEHHIWDVEKVQLLTSEAQAEATFFCGGSRNFHRFIHLFDEVFVLQVDAATLNARLDARQDNDWGKRPGERALILRLHRSGQDTPAGGVSVDATRALERVVDEIVARAGLSVS